MERNDIIYGILIPSLQKLYEVDYFNIYYGASERCICARLAHHMENNMRSTTQLNLDDYFVDVEYNRMGSGHPKYYESHKDGPKYMVSDLLVRGRGHLQNLLAVEMKRNGNPKKLKEDRERLECMVSAMSNNPDSNYIYNTLVGAFIIYSPKEVIVEVFEDADVNGKSTEEIIFICHTDGDRTATLEVKRDTIISRRN